MKRMSQGVRFLEWFKITEFPKFQDNSLTPKLKNLRDFPGYQDVFIP